MGYQVKESRKYENPVTSAFNHLEKSVKKVSPCINGFSGVLILELSFVSSSIITMWPQHDVIQCPKYWYEPMMIIFFGASWIFSAKTMTEGRIIYKNPFVFSTKELIHQFACYFLGLSVPLIVTNIVWAHILDFGYPMPFTGLVLSFSTNFIFWPILFWFLFPLNLRESTTNNRKQMLA